MHTAMTRPRRVRTAAARYSLSKQTDSVPTRCRWPPSASPTTAGRSCRENGPAAERGEGTQADPGVGKPDVPHVESKVSQTRVDVGAAVARGLQARVCEEISREQCPEHERKVERQGGSPSARRSSRQRPTMNHVSATSPNTATVFATSAQEDSAVLRKKAATSSRVASNSGSHKVVIAMIGTKSKTMPTSPAAPVARARAAQGSVCDMGLSGAQPLHPSQRNAVVVKRNHSREVRLMANVVDSVSELAVESGFSGVIRVDRRGGFVVGGIWISRPEARNSQGH